MSIFWIGGPEGIIVPTEDIKFNPDEDRYFMPGAIHGSEDYIIQAYYWSNGEGPECDRIGVKYLYANSILEWARESVNEHGFLDEDVFAELINDNAEEFVVENDGTGDFVSLNEAWSNSFALSYQDIVSWAHAQIDKSHSPFVKTFNTPKLSLSAQIESVADRASVSHSTDKTPAKEYSLEI